VNEPPRRIGEPSGGDDGATIRPAGAAKTASRTMRAWEEGQGAGVNVNAFEPYTIAAGLCALNLVWLFVSALGLPGNWLMVATTTAVAVWQWDSRMIGPWALGIVFALAIAGEVV
jgi:hypothetical protein